MAVARRLTFTGLACLPALVLGAPAGAESYPYLAALGTDAFLRAGADSRYYPFGRLETGDVVKVIGEKAGWARVATQGPAFEELFGYVIYPKTEAGYFEIGPDGTTGTTAAPTDLFAPNLDAKFEPRSSWKPAATLAAGRVLVIIETATVDGDVVHKVKLPDEAEGWIDLAQLRPAAPAEVATWEAWRIGAHRDAHQDAPDAAPPPPVDEIVQADGRVLRPMQEPLARIQPNAAASIDAAQPTVDEPGPPAPAAPAPPPPSPQTRIAQVMLDDLESAYARLLEEPIETAEVAPLRQLYLDLAARYADRRTLARYADRRAKQLELWAEVQGQRQEIAQLRAKASAASQSAAAARDTIDAMAGYAAVGRLDASTIYDGKRLPKLLRICDPATGRTIAYLEPDDGFDYGSMVGRTIGIVGEHAYDGSLRVNVVHPRMIEILDPES